MNAPTSQQVVAVLRKAGYSAYQYRKPGFKVWSSYGGPVHLSQYGYPQADERSRMLDTYEALLAAAGITTERHGHYTLITGRI